jgi:hypothetical protein
MPRSDYENLLQSIKASARVNVGRKMDLYKLIRVADALQLGDRLFQERLSDYAKVDGWTDAALLVAEAAVAGPMRLILKTGLRLNETPSAQLGADSDPVHAATLGLAILGAVLQYKLKELEEGEALLSQRRGRGKRPKGD